ncbi:succinyl-diaminopimelate desuccinylase [Natronincola peptidivorans]|uniref:Succinyl-diaminopimelate desuccinylase n=1 Tax=Natronincola peptidivorans TaxID=426128 RepID=A0A1H9ZMI8_9FIRM|nr:M20/M25/M40 family metallo-hydrolase [Natronincola peptidivorans]SES82833.1 succinyl-diaminopimelate desuccinylase [Natronincola peptidivorans]
MEATKDLSQYINREKVVALLTDLVKIYSPYFKEDEIMKYTHKWLKDRGMDANFHHYHEKKVTNFRGTNVVGRLQGKDEGPIVLLNGHLDTVEICEGWTKDPLGAKIEGNKLYGVGALDMKSGCAAMMLAIDAFNNTVQEFNGEVLYTFVSDEEGPYGLGTDALILDGYTDYADVAIVTEPSSGFLDEVFPCLCLGARGGWNYTVTFKGKSAHAASPEKGVDAIGDAAKVLLELQNAPTNNDPKLGTGSIAVIEFKGGGAACSVADTASFTVFRHTVRGEDLSYLRREVEEAIQRAGIQSTATMQFREAPHPDSGGFHPYIVSESNPYTRVMKSTMEKVVGKPAKITYFPSIGDFNSLGDRAKLPTYVFGPVGKNYHSADEYVEIDSVVKTAEIIYHYLVEILV